MEHDTTSRNGLEWGDEFKNISSTSVHSTVGTLRNDRWRLPTAEEFKQLLKDDPAGLETRQTYWMGGGAENLRCFNAETKQVEECDTAKAHHLKLVRDKE
jgi:hypothetical protein